MFVSHRRPLVLALAAALLPATAFARWVERFAT